MFVNLKKREMHLHKRNQTFGLSCIVVDNKRVKFIHPLQLIETVLIISLTYGKKSMWLVSSEKANIFKRRCQINSRLQ